MHALFGIFILFFDCQWWVFCRRNKNLAHITLILVNLMNLCSVIVICKFALPSWKYKYWHVWNIETVSIKHPWLRKLNYLWTNFIWAHMYSKTNYSSYKQDSTWIRKWMDIRSQEQNGTGIDILSVLGKFYHP